MIKDTGSRARWIIFSSSTTTSDFDTIYHNLLLTSHIPSIKAGNTMCSDTEINFLHATLVSVVFGFHGVYRNTFEGFKNHRNPNRRHAPWLYFVGMLAEVCTTVPCPRNLDRPSTNMANRQPTQNFYLARRMNSTVIIIPAGDKQTDLKVWLWRLRTKFQDGTVDKRRCGYR